MFGCFTAARNCRSATATAALDSIAAHSAGPSAPRSATAPCRSRDRSSPGRRYAIAPLHLILARDEIARLQRWARSEYLLAALAAEAGFALQRRVAIGAEALVLRDLRVEQDGLLGIGGRQIGQGDQPRAQLFAAGPRRRMRWCGLEPAAARLTGDEPVPVITFEEDLPAVGVNASPRRFTVAEMLAVTGTAFGSAWPHTSQ